MIGGGLGRALRAVGAIALVGMVPTSAVAASILHTCDFGSTLCSTDTTTGVNTYVGGFGYGGTYGNAFDLNGVLYATTASNSLATVNLSTGAATLVGPLATNAYAIDFDSQGRLFMMGWNGGLYQVNPANGAGTLIGYTGVGDVMDIAFDSNDNLIATVSGILYRINPSTGSVIGTVGTNLGGELMGIMFDEFDTLWGTRHTSGSGLYTINPNTGVGTFAFGSSINGPHGGDIYVADAPATGSLTLVGLALVTALASRRSRAPRAR